jgi:hypothetical protein
MMSAKALTVDPAWREQVDSFLSEQLAIHARAQNGVTSETTVDPETGDETETLFEDGEQLGSITRSTARTTREAQ